MQKLEIMLQAGKTAQAKEMIQAALASKARISAWSMPRRTSRCRRMT